MTGPPEECARCAVIGEQILNAARNEGQARGHVIVLRAAIVVALRMAERAGVKPQTDDERALVARFAWEVGLPAANRKICHPGIPPVARAVYVAHVQLCLDEAQEALP